MILLLAATAPSTLAALLAVDYGAEWTKASLVKPGTPFDVLLDKGRLWTARVPVILTHGLRLDVQILKER